ncbi:hypothetical protein SAMN04489729_2659 [Amycolatopsis lurida]|uniref:STAS domain-containing protein n=1 Tax=Amycolatopsis lurida NRRL 2430 TaxID=1460371 RepID=A0A2P2FI23_AMYLU|nr:hypothetical protein [Amycolatopsis lurida]KFU76366.1 hypothetical protein BB31_36585 [Amycolatopsis lurida NRRL 2430]SEC86529.1 hypothetical protein SAMN04489729_2659 [Amycolatopsis lurida]
MEDAASAGGQRRDHRIEAGLRILDLPTSSGIMVIGTIDPASRASWETSLHLLVEDGGGTVDLSCLSFTDVRGMSALVDAARRVQPPRSLKIRHPPETVRKVLRLFWPEEAARLVADDGRSI